MLCVLPLVVRLRPLPADHLRPRSARRSSLERGIAFPGRIVEVLERERITGCPAVPTIFQRAHSPRRASPSASCPTCASLTNAGAALPAPAIAAVRRDVPAARALYSMYGQTECKRVCYLPPTELDAPPELGRASRSPGPRRGSSDEDGTRADPGEVGQLVVRGAARDAGLLGRPARPPPPSCEPADGRGRRVLLTGDLFRTDEEGFLYFVGRTDDIIKSRGEKVAPREVEEALHAAPGVPRRRSSASPTSSSARRSSPTSRRPRAPSSTRPRCAATARSTSRTTWCPTRVVVHDALPKTPNGKIDRQALLG